MLSTMKKVIGLPLGATGVALLVMIAAMALLAPLLPLPGPASSQIANALSPPSAAHLFGTDSIGRDVLSRVIWGGRNSLVIGIAIVVIGLAGGVALGLLAGYFAGGPFEEIAMRAVEVFAAIPLLVWAIALVGIVGTGPVDLGVMVLPNSARIVLLVGLLFIPGIARITHGLALAESRAEYVDARRLQGANPIAIMVGDILPNILSPILVQASVLVGIGIIIEASLSFIGLGVQPPTPSWGGMLADAKTTLFSGEWWMSLFPGLAIFLSVIGFNLVGDALRAVLDPRRSTAMSGTAT